MASISSTSIESTSLRRRGFIGSTILQIPGNEKVAYLIGMLDSKHLADVFNKTEVMEVLRQIPTDRALAIAEIYSSFFYKGISNVFSKYISDQTKQDDSALASNNPFDVESDPCKTFREIYLKTKEVYDRIEAPVVFQKRKYASSRAEYLYNAVTNTSKTDISVIQPTCTDYLTVFMFLFNRRTTAEMKEYLWHLSQLHNREEKDKQ